ncbi:unnamed protein product [Didymodactylos carnosus]|uniref:Uncharacterized protein n=1 Tax=Didymodactylos carnosus TaxID=1234261 RepID=A0A8S2DYD3_9BILA|nr:unnamed protein product [Didymodactylos carnosus]CAF3808453.1 unnamed protein product [Didymodactylos carnosus]
MRRPNVQPYSKYDVASLGKSLNSMCIMLETLDVRESKSIDLTIGFLLKPLLAMMKLTGLYYEHSSKPDKQKQNRLHLVYCIFVCFLSWSNTLRFISIFFLTNFKHKAEQYLPLLMTTLVAQLWLLLCSCSHTTFIISSYQRNKLYTIMFNYNFCKLIKCQPGISKRFKFGIYSTITLCLITILSNTLALLIAYFGPSKYMKVFQMFLTPFHQKSTITHNIPYKLFICLLHFYASAAWILPPTLFCILCLIGCSEFEKFNEYIKQEVQQSNAQERVEYWRQSHSRLIKLVHALDSTFQIYVSLALSINIVMAFLMLYIIAMMWTHRLDLDLGPLFIVMVNFWAFCSMFYVFVVSATAGVLNSVTRGSLTYLHQLPATGCSIDFNTQVIQFKLNLN